ncbi:MAG: SCO family protein [Bacteroidetes bacterium]|nr:SCO family protein [Bacteroidota bacterium]
MSEGEINRKKGKIQALLVLSVLVMPLLIWAVVLVFGETHCKPLMIVKTVNAQGDSLPRLLPEVKGLVDQTGKPFAPTQLKGRHHLAGFIFTTCPIACPLVSDAMRSVFTDQQGFKDVLFVSYTVDPANDSLPVMRDYALTYTQDARLWAFVSGDSAALRTLIMEGYLQSVKDTPELPEKITHSSMLVLVDADSRLRGFYNSQEPADMKRLQEELNVLRCEYKQVKKQSMKTS